MNSLVSPRSEIAPLTSEQVADFLRAHPAFFKDHLSVLGHPEALEAALAWYRSNKGLAADVGTIAVPTLYVWGDADATVGPDAAYGTADFVKPAFAMEVLPGVGHFVMDQAPAKATDLLLAHLAKHPV